MRGDTEYLKDKEDENNDSDLDEIVTDEEDVVETVNTADEVGMSLTRVAASTRRCCAVQRSVVLVVTSPSSLLLSVSSQPVPDGGVSSNLF